MRREKGGKKSYAEYVMEWSINIGKGKMLLRMAIMMILKEI